MSEISTIYKISIIACALFFGGKFCCMLVIESCWFVQEKPGHGGGFSVPMSQEKSLMFIRTEAFSEESRSELHPPADISFFQDLLCDRAALNPPKVSVNKPKCEINPFMPHASMVRWASALTDSAQSPVYLQADWFSVAAQGLDEQLTLSNVKFIKVRGTKLFILSVSSKTPVVRSRLGEAFLLDCGFWVDPSSPVHGSGFSIEWRYQFRGEGRLVLAYDGKNDRFAETSETGFINSMCYNKFQLYVTTPSFLPEPPSLSIYPSPLPLLVPGQVLLVQCEASGFAPHTLDLSWEFSGADGTSRSLGQGSVTGHRQASDGTFSQSNVTCVAKHEGGTRVSAPSIEDSMAMVAVALVLYGTIKFLSWTFSSSGNDTYLKDKVNNNHFC
uniref:Ig-like domain-containing protein n=1 Tax=Sinocyclocheilus anshuiensis TaxID=1608454 RepID=A0A671LMU3_9TELE